MAAKSSDEESQFEKNVVTRNGFLLAPALHEVICLCDRNAEIGNIKLLRETLDRVFMIQSEQQFAEKVHTYTLPREGAPNSRVRDLVDLAILVQSGIMNNLRVAAALQRAFARRGTHELPEHLTIPPEDWAAPFARMAEECALEMDATAAFHEVARYFEDVLALDSGV